MAWSDIVNSEVGSSVRAKLNSLGANVDAIAVQAYNAGAIFASTADAMSNGVIGSTSLVAGSGGTNGTFAVAFAGGSGTGAAAQFTVTGGALVSVIITAKGVNYTSAPTMAFTASTGLTGASAVAQIGINVAVGNSFILQGTGNTYGTLYRNVAGVATSQNISIPSLASIPADATKLFGPINGFDKTTITTGSVLFNGAPSAANSNYYYSDYIPVVAGQTWVLSHTPNNGSGQGVTFADVSKVYTTVKTDAVAGTPFTIPAGAFFMRITWYSLAPALAGDIMVVLGSVLPSVYLQYGIPSYRQAATTARAEANALRYKGSNLFIPGNRIVNTDLNTSDVTSVNANAFVSDYIKVTPGAVYTIFPATSFSATFGYNFYNYDKVFLSAVGNGYTANQNITIPAGCEWIRFLGLNAALATYSFITGSAAAGSGIYRNPATLNDANQWAGKNFCFLGDSILALTGWPTAQLMPLIGGYLDTKHAAYVSGRGLAAGLTDVSGTAFVAGDFTSIDYVHIELITNNLGSTIGTSADSSATASVWGWYKNIIGTLQGWNPAMRITMQTPYYRGDGPDVSVGVSVANAVGAYYGIPVWQAHLIGGWGAGNAATQLQADLVHPTAAGVTNGCLPSLRAFIMNQYPNVL